MHPTADGGFKRPRVNATSLGIMAEPKKNVLSFVWDKAEALTPDGYLTPVYFNKQVLVRYLYDPRFSCDFASDTYGTVHGPDFSISFGINSNGSVIVWLGDLMEQVPKREQFYWLVENKEPENDIASEFYDAQINVVFTEPPEAIRCLNELAKLNAAFHRIYGTLLYKEQSIESRLEATRRYKRVMLNNVDDFKRFISELNEIITENTNNSDIRHFLRVKSIPVESASKGNKLLEKIYTNILGDDKNLIAPFFYLYDLRLWADHAVSVTTYDDVVKKLGLQPSSGYDEPLSALFNALTDSFKRLRELVDA